MLAVVALVVLARSSGSDPEAPNPEPSSDRLAPGLRSAPNILVVMTDDQPLASFSDEVMPRTRRLLAEHGTTFEQAIAAPPLCCPSRAGFLTGRYAQNHGVVENDVGYRSMRDKAETLPAALQAAGYRTGLVGKFLNGYEAEAGTAPAPGFDYWYALYGYADYFEYQVSDQGELRDVSGYSTSDLSDRAAAFITDRDEARPFFLWLSYNAPHTVLPTGAGACGGLAAQPPSEEAYSNYSDASLPSPPSFDEVDISDKPSLRGGPGPVKAGRLDEMTQQWRCALSALSAVDNELARVIDSLRGSGQLDRTIIVYLSDNGYFFGEHRLGSEKRLPLEPSLRIPLGIWVGQDVQNEPPPPSSSALVSQVDLAPTLLDYAGVDPCRVWERCVPMDGQSLRPLLEGSGGWSGDRVIPLSLDDGWRYNGLRTETELYLELEESRWRSFSPPAIEYYDLRSDPDQLENLAASDGGVADRLDLLGAQLGELSRCAGIEGRDDRVDDRPFCG